MSTTSDRPTFVVHLMPSSKGDGLLDLRALLKVALRRFGLRCVGLRILPPDGLEPNLSALSNRTRSGSRGRAAEKSATS